MTAHLPYPIPCSVCGSQPDIGKCEPWPRDYGPQPWYAICYREDPSHCVGDNGASQREAMENWNRTASSHALPNRGGVDAPK